MTMKKDFLPISSEDLARKCWKELDIIIVTGDSYVAHPSYGASVIGRVLEDAGFRVGIIAQPDWRKVDDFKRLGRPRLFFAVTSGNLDSMVANYTANKRSRRQDDYSPGGRTNLRPDRAVIVYTNRVKEAFPDTLVVIGWIEASLRRLAHYDYWSNTVRRAILTDAKADILIYGMAETQIIEIANGARDGVAGTAGMRNSIDDIKGCITLPSFEDVRDDKNKLNQAIMTIHRESDPFRGNTLAQRHGERFVVQFPPAMPLEEKELDRIYSLDYARSWHPIYERDGGVPGFETVRLSIQSHRGCPGSCTFCSLSLHQGRILQSRSEGSILDEIKKLSKEDYFKGTVTDIGGPTANLYKTTCGLWKGTGACVKKDCLFPRKCERLLLGYPELTALLKRARAVPKVKHVFIGSGFRHDLLVDGYSDSLLEELCGHHVSGQMKIAPEHTSNPVLRLMRKPSFDIYERFVSRFDSVNKKVRKEQYLVNYFIIGHPGCALKDALNLAIYLIKHRMRPEQVQDFIPLPLTIAGAMYYTEKDSFTGRAIYVAKTLKERKMQRALVQYYQPQNKALVLEALRLLDRMDLKGLFAGKGKRWNIQKEESTEYLY